MSQMVRAETKIKRILPNMFREVAKKMAVNTDYSFNEGQNGVTLQSKTRSYDRIRFSWDKPASLVGNMPIADNFKVEYDQDHAKEAIEMYKKVINNYTIGVTMAAAQANEGYVVQQIKTLPDGSLQLVMGK